VLLLDEPTSGLDEMATAAVETLIAERRAEGAAVLWVSHDPGQAARIARRRLAVADGRVTEVAA
jgi:ABC-type phosphate transport system ATPase subunit